MNIEQFGRKIIEELLSKKGDSFEILRRQFKDSKVKLLDYTGSGFFIHYGINPKNEKVKIKNIEIGGTCKINDSRSIYDIVLFIRNGVIDFLEAVVFGEGNFPKEIQSYEFEPSEDSINKLISSDADSGGDIEWGR